MLASSPVEKNINLGAKNVEKLPPNQRWAVIFLSVLGLGIIIFWGWQFRARVSGPFKTEANKTNSTQTASSTDLVKDTDGDGLTDYDETTIYKTSPYLSDSDSDGIPDGQEIKQGSDPNCPAGTTCGLESITPPSQTSTSTILGETTAVASTTLEEKLINGEITAAELRQVLLNNGADKTALDQINDADLLKGYQQMLQAQLSASSTTPQINASSTLPQ